jgi:hypothetical protein
MPARDYVQPRPLSGPRQGRGQVGAESSSALVAGRTSVGRISASAALTRIVRPPGPASVSVAEPVAIANISCGREIEIKIVDAVAPWRRPAVLTSGASNAFRRFIRLRFNGSARAGYRQVRNRWNPVVLVEGSFRFRRPPRLRVRLPASGDVPAYRTTRPTRGRDHWSFPSHARADRPGRRPAASLGLD